MRPDEVAVFVIDIDFFFACPDFKFLSQIFPWHAIMDLVEGEGESCATLTVFRSRYSKQLGGRGKRVSFSSVYKEVVPGISEPFKGLSVLSIHLFHQDAV